MKKWSDYKGDEAIDLLADILEPLVAIIADDEIRKLAKDKKAKRIQYVTVALREHKAEVIGIMARIADVPVEEYKESINLLTLPLQILEIINDPMVSELFTSQSQTQITSLASSGSAMENTEAEGT